MSIKEYNLITPSPYLIYVLNFPTPFTSACLWQVARFCGKISQLFKTKAEYMPIPVAGHDNI